MKIKKGKEVNLTLEECINLMRGRVSHFNVAGRDIFEDGYYVRGRSQRYKMNRDIYFLNENSKIECLCFDCSPHRAKVLLNALINGSINSVHPEIVNNYATNGYNTRSGLFHSVKKLDRIKQVARSHSEYLGNETGNSKIDHDNRVSMRN
jgi:hypothetical protein